MALTHVINGRAQELKKMLEKDNAIAQLAEEATGDTLLMIAIRKYKESKSEELSGKLLNVIEALIKNHADLMYYNNAGENALDLVTQSDSDDRLKKRFSIYQ